MLRMSIWVHSYAVIHVWTTVNFRKNRARLGLCDDAMKWFLRLQLCNPSLNVSHIRIGCIQNVLVPCYAGYGHMGPPLHCSASAGQGLIWGFGGRPEPKWYCSVIVEATTGFRLDPTSVLDVYKVFWHRDMLCMGIWGHPYTAPPVQAGVEFWEIGPGWGSKVPKTTSTSISYIYKVF